MKKITYSVFIMLLNITSLDIIAQNNSLDIGIFNFPKGSNKLEIRLKPNQNIANANYTGGIFTIRYPTSSGVTLSPLVNPYGYGTSKVSNHSDGFTYCSYNYAAASSVVKLNWSVNQENVILVLQTSALTSSNATFELVTSQPWNEINGGNYYQELNADASVGAQNVIYNASTGVTFPVELLSFQATKKGETSLLNWECTKEKSVSIYSIERSIDGVNFKTIGYEKPKAKNQDEKVAYTFIDEKPELGINYYRLQMKSIDNNVEYSKIINVDFGNGVKGKIYPNPSTTELILEFDVAYNMTGNALIELFDIAGKQVFSKTIAASGRKLTYNVPIEDLVAGDYIIRAKNGSNTWQQKITKQ